MSFVSLAAFTKMGTRISKPLVIAALGTALLTGCVSKILESKNDESQVYVLKAAAVNSAALAFPVQLSVALPSAAPGLDSNRIAALTDNRLDYFYGARWGGTAPQVVQQFIIDTLQATQGFKSVSAEGALMTVNQLLDVRLKDFQAEYSNGKLAPTIKVTLIGTLIEVSSRKAAAPITVSAAVPASDNRLSAVVTAYQQALQTTSNSLAEQIIGRVTTP